MDHAPVHYKAPTSNGPGPTGQHSTNLVLSPYLPSSNGATPTSVNDSRASPASVAPRTIPQQQTFNHLDLELIHYYSTQTYMTMTSRLTAHLVWRDVTFRHGLKHDFLLHALMATAALHKATKHSEDTEIHAEYIKVAFSYQNAALAGYIPALSRPDESNAIALFILSALLTIWLFGSKKLPEVLHGVNLSNSPAFGSHQTTPSDTEPPVFYEILNRIHGIHAVFKQTTQWLKDSEVTPLLEPPKDAELPQNPPDIEASFEKLQKRIDGVAVADPQLSEATIIERTEMYYERLQHLRRVSRCRTVLGHDQQVFAWPVTSGPQYLELIRRRDPVAIALFVHWAACFRCLDHLWWAKGWSYRLVKDASSLLDSTWSDVIAWPLKEVGLD